MGGGTSYYRHGVGGAAFAKKPETCKTVSALWGLEVHSSCREKQTCRSPLALLRGLDALLRLLQAAE